MSGDSDSLRIDRWLWAARVFKTRSLAAAACAGGKVDVNEQSVKPARLVRPGDLVRVTIGAGRRVLRISGLSEHRGPSPEARMLYEDTVRGEEYAERVAKLKIERAEFLGQYPSLSAVIVASVG